MAFTLTLDERSATGVAKVRVEAVNGSGGTVSFDYGGGTNYTSYEFRSGYSYAIYVHGGGGSIKLTAVFASGYSASSSQWSYNGSTSGGATLSNITSSSDITVVVNAASGGGGGGGGGDEPTTYQVTLYKQDGVDSVVVKDANSKTKATLSGSATSTTFSASGSLTFTMTKTSSQSSDRYRMQWRYRYGTNQGELHTANGSTFTHNDNGQKLIITAGTVDTGYTITAGRKDSGIKSIAITYGNSSSYSSSHTFGSDNTHDFSVWGTAYIQAVLNSDYQFLKWEYSMEGESSGTSTNNPYTYNATQRDAPNLVINGSTKSNAYTIHLYRDSTGIASTTAGAKKYDNTFPSQGSDSGVQITSTGSFTFDAELKSGYAFDHWVIREGSQSASTVSPAPTARPYTYTPKQKTDGSGYMDIWIRAAARERPQGEKPALWDWNIQNGDEATKAETKTAYGLLTTKGQTNRFSYKVWNDICDKVNEVLTYDGRQWATRSSDGTQSYLALSNTKMTASGQTLTAARFNALRFNIGARYSVPVPTDPDDASQAGVPYATTGKKVYGRYFTRLTDYINAWIESL